MASKKITTKPLIFTIISILLILLLVGCQTKPTVVLEKIEVINSKLVYGLGEELDTSSLKFVLSYSDNTVVDKSYKDLSSEVVVYNFSTTKETAKLSILFEYQSKTATTDIVVSKEAISSITYNVNYLTNGGTKLESIAVSQYSKLTEPLAPTKSGFIFDGWYKDVTFTNKWNFVTDKISADTDLYAKWANLYKYTFVLPDGSLIIKEVKEGSTLADIPEVPARDGFEGRWNRSSWSDVKSDATITALYTQLSYKVTFLDYDNTELKTDTVKWGGNATAPVSNPNNKLHYHFVRWEGDFTNVKGTKIIYAVYELDTHKVVFDAKGGVLGDDLETDFNGERYSTTQWNTLIGKPTDPIRTNYQFDGWYHNSSFAEADKVNFNNDKITSNVVFFAKWTRLYKITFLADHDGDGINTEIVGSPLYVRDGASTSPLNIPNKVGYDAIWDRINFTNITEDITINAVYTIKKYVVQFVGYDGAIILEYKDDNRIVYNQIATAPKNADIPSRLGHTFNNWSDGYNRPITADSIFRAEYIINSYSVLFSDSLNGTSNEVNSLFGSKLTEPQIPTKDGYRFLGWYKDVAGANKWNFEVDVIQGVTNLYAVWVKQWTLTFIGYIVEDQTVVTVDEGASLYENDLPMVPYREGFDGRWPQLEYLNIRNNATIIATYTVAYFTVAFLSYDLSPVLVNGQTTQLVEYGKNAIVPKPPMVVGRTFSTWDSSTQGIKASIEIKALYRINQYKIDFLIATFDNSGNETQPVIYNTYLGEHGKLVTKPTKNPSLVGYVFNGWKKIEGDSFVDWDFTNQTISKATSFKASFVKQKFKVDFVSESNTLFEQILGVEYNTPVSCTREDIPSMTGYHFVGWDYNSDGMFDTILDDKNSNLVVTDRIINAIFAVNIYNITFDSNGGSDVTDFGGSNIQTKTYNSFVTKPVDPVYKDKAFLGWFFGNMDASEIILGFKVDFSTYRADSNITLYAKWEDTVTTSYGVEYTFNMLTAEYSVSKVESDVANITITNFVNGYPVTSIGSNAFLNNTTLVSVSLPSTIRVISPNAFNGCNQLVSINIPSNVVSIGDSAFKDAGLISITFQNGSLLERIDNFAFFNNSQLSSLTLPNGLKHIGDSAFYSCGQLTNVSFPSNLTEIGARAFSNATNLKYVNFNADIAINLGAYAFSNNSDSFRIYVPKTESYLNSIDFLSYKNIILDSNLVSKDGVWSYRITNASGVIRGTSGSNTSISYTAIELVQYLGIEKSIIIPENIELKNGKTLPIYKLGSLLAQENIETLNTSASIAIDANTLTNLVNLKRLNITYAPTTTTTLYIIGSNGETKTENAILINNFRIDKAHLYNSIMALSSLSSLGMTTYFSLSEMLDNRILPANITEIELLYSENKIVPKGMLEGASNVSKVALPSNITEIGERAFYNMKALTSVVNVNSYPGLPNSVTLIGKSAFFGCAKLEALSLGIGVERVGDEAFGDMRKLKTLFLPDSITSIGTNILGGATALESLSIYNVGSTLDNAYLGYYFGAVRYNNQVSYVPASLKTVTVRSKTVPTNAFFGLNNITVN